MTDPISMKRAIVGALLNRKLLVSKELLENLDDSVYLRWAYENFCQSDFIVIVAVKDGQSRRWSWQGKTKTRDKQTRRQLT